MGAYVSAFNAVGAALRAKYVGALATAGAGQQPGAPAPRTYGMSMGDFFQESATELGRIAAPEDIRTLHQDLVSAIRGNADAWHGYAASLTGSDSQDRLAAVSTAVASTSDAASARYTAACKALSDRVSSRGYTLDVTC